ncbi:hypothetical protein FRE64_16520 (plasmid) [Euhalothece natronophila Z-M001]|uniref:Uncharacterized protein n=1 Tax=Euhalothece natronophila Z-M001 TaxID=522448 RepID=A0A5B8NRC4_9CHRO|nr:hypothetical protein [Euhalothece natronophila]QDZ41578.1 hypothetical protein FRE64_16520 [Euhalothece natronophila Z-M001]
MISDLDFRNEDGKYPPIGEFDNDQALNQLKKERNKQVLKAILNYGGAISSLWLNTMFSVVFSILGGNKVKEIATLSHMIHIMETLLEHFEDDGIEIIPKVKVPKDVATVNQIDLFVRFPQKIYFAICHRKMNDSIITYREDKETFYIRRVNNRGKNIWKPDPSDYIPECFRWLQKNERSLFGGKSNDTRKPSVRILLLMGETKINKHHPPHLYGQVGDEKFLWIKKQGRGTLTIIEEDRLVKFIKAFVTSKTNSSNSKTKYNSSVDNTATSNENAVVNK